MPATDIPKSSIIGVDFGTLWGVGVGGRKGEGEVMIQSLFCQSALS